MSQWPELSSLEVLVAVADQGSLSAAARALHMAQPNVSRSVSRLEQRLGLVLLRRATTGSTLTPEGLLVVGWARDVLASADALMRNTHALGEGSSGQLAISASQTIAEHLLPGWLAKFRVDEPGIRVTLQITNTDNVLRALHSGECDLGFIEGPIPRGAAHTTALGEDRLVLVVSPSHPWATRKSVHPAELFEGSLITREAGSGTRRVLDEALGAPVEPHTELGSNAAVRVAVLSGAGPAVLSNLAVSDAVASGALIEVPIKDLSIRRRLRAAWTGPRQVHGSARKMLQVAVVSSAPNRAECDGG